MKLPQPLLVPLPLVPPITLLLLPSMKTPDLALGIAPVPMKLPWIRLAVAKLPLISTPWPLLPEMTLRAAALVPPIRLLVEEPVLGQIKTPDDVLGRAAVPLTLVPM